MITPRLLPRSTTRRAFPAALLSLAVLLATVTACGGDSSTDTANIVLLDQSFALTAGEGCDVGGVSMDFNGSAGKAVTIDATGASSLTPRFTLYAPDFETQLGSSTANGAGKARLVFTLAVSGAHHITLCEATGKTGSVHVRVTTPALAG